MRWQRGQAEITELVDRGDLIPITDGRTQAAQLATQARARLRELTAQSGDERASSQLAIVALCAQALLAEQGLAASAAGGRRVASEVMDHQFLGDLGAGPFDSLRSIPHPDGPAQLTSDEANADSVDAAAWALEFTERLLRSGLLHVFDARPVRETVAAGSSPWTWVPDLDRLESRT